MDNSNNLVFPFAINTLDSFAIPHNPERLLYLILDNFSRRPQKRACSERLNTLCTPAFARACPQGKSLLPQGVRHLASYFREGETAPIARVKPKKKTRSPPRQPFFVIGAGTSNVSRKVFPSGIAMSAQERSWSGAHGQSFVFRKVLRGLA